MINKVLLMEFFKDDDIKVVDKDFYIKSQMKSDVIKYITILEEENEKLSNIINEFEIWLSNEMKFQRVIDRDYELTKTWFNLQNIKENILNGGDE